MFIRIFLFGFPYTKYIFIEANFFADIPFNCPIKSNSFSLLKCLLSSYRIISFSPFKFKFFNQFQISFFCNSLKKVDEKKIELHNARIILYYVVSYTPNSSIGLAWHLNSRSTYFDFMIICAHSSIYTSICKSNVVVSIIGFAGISHMWHEIV